MRSVMSDTTGMDPEMVSTLRGEMKRGEKVRLLTKGPTENTARWQQALSRTFGKATKFLRGEK
jgi:hypothetical protein